MEPTLRSLGLDADDVQVGEQSDPNVSRRIGAWCTELRGHSEVRDAVPGLVGAVIHWQPEVQSERRRTLALTTWDAAVPSDSGRELIIAVVFDGPDLAEVATRVGLSSPDVIERICARPLIIACIGFLPGFPYLLGLDPRLNLPRRASPRTRVNAGSVAIAAGMAGIYPIASPGGWHCLGRCDPAQSLTWEAGDRLRFTAVEQI